MMNLMERMQILYLSKMIEAIGDEVGAPEGASPKQVLEAAQRLREALARAKGHTDAQEIPRTAYRVRGW